MLVTTQVTTPHLTNLLNFSPQDFSPQVHHPSKQGPPLTCQEPLASCGQETLASPQVHHPSKQCMGPPLASGGHLRPLKRKRSDKPKRLWLFDLAPKKPPRMKFLSDTSLIEILSVPDIIIFNKNGRVLFVWEVCKKSSRLLCTSLYYIFLQLKMYTTQMEAEHQMRLSIFGNWRKGVLAMGGATSVGGVVSMANTFPSLLCSYLPLTNSVGYTVHIYILRSW